VRKERRSQWELREERMGDFLRSVLRIAISNVHIDPTMWKKVERPVR
jgi:hypothetical protein